MEDKSTKKNESIGVGALYEVVLMVILSTLPIWLGTIILSAVKIQGEVFPVDEAIKETIQNGELYIYSATLLAPILIWFFIKPDGEKTFENIPIFGPLVLIVWLLSSLAFSFTRAGAELIKSVAFEGSLIFFTASCLLLYWGTLKHKKGKPDFTDFRTTRSKKLGSFQDDYKKHREENK